jgi:chromate transporter
LWVLAAFAFIAIFFFQGSFLWIILLAALGGFFGKKWAPGLFPSAGSHGRAARAGEQSYLILPAVIPRTWLRTGRISLIGLILWGGPILLLGQIFGWASTPTQQGLFFSQSAVVTFGGGYAVLPYVTQQAVEKYAWLTHGQMMAGLGLAESTPGPLIIVLQFVGFVGGWQHPGSLSPLGGALIGAMITTWVTFIPSFLMIFLGAPYVEKIRHFPQLSAALSAITAAVVGVIMSLAVKFAQHTFFTATGSSPDWFALALAVAAFVALVWKKLPLIPVIGAGAVIGLAWKLLS